MRSNNRPKELYQKIYDQDTEFIETSEARLKKIAELKGWDFENIPSCYMDIADNYYLRFYVGYTMGKDYEDLMIDARKYVENGLKGCDGKVYGELENLIYFIIIFDFFEYKDDIKKLIEQYDSIYKDNYMERIYKLIDSSYMVTNEKQYWPKDNKPMFETIILAETDKTAAVQRLKKYVDKEWFKTLNEGLITNRVDSHGFWCIEAAALVKALDLDDTLLKNSKYYPYDMAHLLDKYMIRSDSV